jgi:hypothetical protein
MTGRDDAHNRSPVSIGQLPPPERFRQRVDGAHTRFESVEEGRNAVHPPALDGAGNSITGRFASPFHSERLDLSLFASRPRPIDGPTTPR